MMVIAKFSVVMPKAKPCEHCDGLQEVRMEVTESGFSVGAHKNHTSDCQELFCSHGVRYASDENCDPCDDENLERYAWHCKDGTASQDMIDSGWNGPGWYFSDETDSYHGPFETRHKVLAALRDYTRQLG